LCKRKFDNFSQFIRRKVGLSDVDIPDPADLWIGVDPNSYAFQTDHYGYSCLFAGEERHFELSEGGIQPIQKRNRNNVYGCGLVLDPEDKLAIFFSLNGKLLGKLMLDILKIFQKNAYRIFSN
jgi:hypothetical protein